MLNKKYIQQLLEESIAGTDFFVVEVTIDQSNNIKITLDSDTQITVDDCADVSRYVEDKLNQSDEDFALEVSSAGLDRPLELLRQYRKHIGEQVSIKFYEGPDIKGTLKNVSDDSIELEYKSREKTDSQKKKTKTITKTEKIPFNIIKSTKVMVSFK